jgi:hypothetical protein
MAATFDIPAHWFPYTEPWQPEGNTAPADPYYEDPYFPDPYARI